jgi:hypothetical protein
MALWSQAQSHFKVTMVRSACFLVSLLLSCAAAADIIPEGAQSARVPIELVQGKPMMAVHVDAPVVACGLTAARQTRCFSTATRWPWHLGLKWGAVVLPRARRSWFG